jgi:hypothetical protein
MNFNPPRVLPILTAALIVAAFAGAPAIRAQTTPDPQAAANQQHDVRHDQDELAKNHNQAAHDQRALSDAEKDGNTAAAAHDKSALHDARHDEHGDHHLATKHRKTETKDSQ